MGCAISKVVETHSKINDDSKIYDILIIYSQNQWNNIINVANSCKEFRNDKNIWLSIMNMEQKKLGKFMTFLMYNATKGNLDRCKFLLDCNADITKIDKNGRCALQYAIENNRIDIINLFLQHKNSKDFICSYNHMNQLNLKDKRVYTNGPRALYAALYTNIQTATILIQNGIIHQNSRDTINSYYDDNPLLFCCIKNIKAVELLITYDIDYTLKNKNNDTILHIAIMNNNINLVKLICSKSEYYKNIINFKNNNNETPLLIAVCNNFSPIVKELCLVNEIDVNIKFNQYTILDYLHEYCNHDIIDSIFNANYKLDIDKIVYYICKYDCVVYQTIINNIFKEKFNISLEEEKLLLENASRDVLLSIIGNKTLIITPDIHQELLLNQISNHAKIHILTRIFRLQLHSLPEQKLISRWYRLENPPKKLIETPYISYYYHETCFHGDGNCLMSNGKYKLVKNLQINDEVITFNGIGKITHIIKSLVKPTTKICKISNLLITELHPIYEKEWIYPKDSKNVSFYSAKDLDLQYVYSIAIDNGYGIKIDDIFVITLAHGINDHKILTHDYYGTRRVLDDYDEIMNKYPTATCIGFDPRINKIILIGGTVKYRS